MQSKELEIINPLGLHARAAAKLVQLSAGFASEISLTKDDKQANAKSIMKVMMLAAARGSLIRIEVTGDDEIEAMAAVSALIEDGFGELE
ncbi:MAG: HPr family phosphocarrier protein [Gammaproteobacteria bacterium]